MERTEKMIGKFDKLIFIHQTVGARGILTVSFREKGEMSTMDYLRFEVTNHDTGTGETFGIGSHWDGYPLLRFMHSKEFYKKGLRRGATGDFMKITDETVILLEYLNDLAVYRDELGLEEHYDVW